MAAEVSSRYAVQMHGITKRFGSFYALTDVDLDVEEGTIHSVLGENGAGKSTLMNVLYGLYQADEGEIYIRGKKVDIRNPAAAIENGIGMVHQHFMLVDNFTVTQNIVLGNEPHAGIFTDMRKARRDVLDIVARYGLQVNPDARIRDISVGMQQRVEILKALYRGADILILDEPTAVLTEQEIDELLAIMKKLVKDGKTIIIITHKLKEIQASSDACTIIRRGHYIDTVPVRGVTEDELAEKMVGREVRLVVDWTPPHPGEVMLDIQSLYVKNDKGMYAVRDLDLQVRSGEIVGIAGIDGNGQQELADALNNLRRTRRGKIILNGHEIQNRSPKYGIDCGMATIPADRHKDGLVLGFSVYENTIMEKYRTEEFSPGGTINRKKVRSFANELIEAYDVRPGNCGPLMAGGLSGGNQQKVIIGREIANDPALLIAIQPTRGLDVGAIENVHRMLLRERDKGVAVLLISFELDEVMNVSDRIAVIYDGHIQQIFEHGTVDNRTLGRVMAGGQVEPSMLKAPQEAGQVEPSMLKAPQEAALVEPVAEAVAEAVREEPVADAAPELRTSDTLEPETSAVPGSETASGPEPEATDTLEPETRVVPEPETPVELITPPAEPGTAVVPEIPAEPATGISLLAQAGEPETADKTENTEKEETAETAPVLGQDPSAPASSGPDPAEIAEMQRSLARMQSSIADMQRVLAEMQSRLAGM